MCELDLDRCTVWREKQVVARRPHKCSSCHRAIAAGEQYVYHFDIFEGQAITAHVCAECAADRQAFARAHNGALVDPETFVEYLDACLDDEPEMAETWQAMIDRITAVRAAIRNAGSEER